MSRFKFGLVLGFVAGWLVATGKGLELLEQARTRLTNRDAAAPAADVNGVYDFAVRAAQ
jgi:hypothetical protein